MQLKTSLRNVFRNRRRTAFSLAVIVVGFVILVSVLGFVGEALQSTKTSLADETGAVQVGSEGLFENSSTGYDYLIPPGQLEQVVAIVSTMPGLVGVSWQLNFAGLVGDEQGSTLIVGRGIVPCSDVQAYECIVSSGSPFEETSDREVILGVALARKLGVAPGDRVNIATGTVSGNFNAATVVVSGEITYALEALEEQLGLFPIAFVQRLLKTDGVERILIRIDDVDQAEAFAFELQQHLQSASIPLVARTWKELNPSYASIESFYGAFSGLAMMGIAVLVFFSVLEVLTISFLERSREVGTLRALGAGRGRVFGSFILEAAFLGIIGAILGALISVALVLVFNAIAFSWIPPGAAIPQSIQLQLSPTVIIMPILTVLFSTLLSAIFPSWRNSRIEIVRALQSV
ncbi:FtsX-like permease family protein [Candidatus Bipolaricaulota bacterium]|nr:FtsX-like permease family protein [Candidatus Bipolaricaulota bacterium]